MSLRLDVNWKVTTFCAVFFPLLLTLGFWQVDRAQQKESILVSAKKQQGSEVVSYLQLKNSGSLEQQRNYKKVFVSGTIIDKYWLIEGRQRSGRVGYEVLIVLTVPDKSNVLVNLGWIAGEQDRRILPEIILPKGSVAFQGELFKPNLSTFIDESNNTLLSWPHRILEVDIDELSKQIDLNLDSQIIRIASDDPLAFDAYWPRINIKPAKHRAYAVQWFALALALALLWFFSNTNIRDVFNNE